MGALLGLLIGCTLGLALLQVTELWTEDKDNDLTS